MAAKEPKENQKTPNVNFINFQIQLRGIIKDIKENKKKERKKEKNEPHVLSCNAYISMSFLYFIIHFANVL